MELAPCAIPRDLPDRAALCAALSEVMKRSLYPGTGSGRGKGLKITCFERVCPPVAVMVVNVRSLSVAKAVAGFVYSVPQ